MRTSRRGRNDIIREAAEKKRKAEEAERQRIAEAKAKWEREEAARAEKAKKEAATAKKPNKYVKPQYVPPKAQLQRSNVVLGV